jgi:hypothetical protein
MTKLDLARVLMSEHNFDAISSSYYYRRMGKCFYNKGTLKALLTIMQKCNIKCDNSVTKNILSKEEIAKVLEHSYSAYNLHFTKGEINYIRREEFIVLYNNLISRD